MDSLEKYGKEAVAAWHSFVQDYSLTPLQAQQFEQYAVSLLAWNEKMNLTAITDIPRLLDDHFRDSLSLTNYVQFSADDWICDVGSGGGFPGIPIKIMFPHLRVVLLEVNSKKIIFLRAMIEQLGLDSTEVCTLDWRTFVHKAPYPITYFLARASLRPDELIRIFARGSFYASATLVYWASATWELGDTEAPYFVREESYMVGVKKRRLIFFQKQMK